MGAQPSPSNTRRHTGGHHLSRHQGLSVKDSSAGGIFRGGTYLRGDKKPAVTQNPTSAGSNPANAKIYSRFTLRDLMLHGNAPLAQLRSPLRRANSMENGATKFSSPTFQTSQKKQTPRTLKKLMRTVDRENRAPEESTLGPPETSYRVTTRVPKTRTAWLVSDGNLVCSGGARASSLTVVPGTTTKSGKRKATPETPEDFSFFVSEINSIGGTSLRERELVDALADVKAAALASRASASLGRWRLAVAIQKANAKVFEKTQTLQEMLRDQAHEFDTEKSSRRAELRAVLDADCALQKTHRETQLKLAEADENVEVLTEALGAASREKWETTWRLAAKAALGNKRASDSRRKLRRVMLGGLGGKDEGAEMTIENAEMLLTRDENDDANAHLRDERKDALTKELRAELTVSIQIELRKALRPIVEAQVRAEARDDLARETKQVAGYKRMAAFGRGFDPAKMAKSAEANEPNEKICVAVANYPASLRAAHHTHDDLASTNWKKEGVPLDSSIAAAAALAFSRKKRLSEPRKSETKNTKSDILSQLAARTVEAVAHHRSRLNPLKGANVMELVALHELAASRLIAHTEGLVHEAEHMFFDPFLGENGCAGAIDSASTTQAFNRGPPHLAPTALTPGQTGARVVVPCVDITAGHAMPGTAPRVTRDARTGTKDVSMWDAWYR